MFYDLITYDYRLILIKSYELNQIRDDENSHEMKWTISNFNIYIRYFYNLYIKHDCKYLVINTLLRLDMKLSKWNELSISLNLCYEWFKVF